eukprot:scaffold34167_cov29-Prasinocladus_malaysianus.AAC.1
MKSGCAVLKNGSPASRRPTRDGSQRQPVQTRSSDQPRIASRLALTRTKRRKYYSYEYSYRQVSHQRIRTPTSGDRRCAGFLYSYGTRSSAKLTAARGTRTVVVDLESLPVPYQQRQHACRNVNVEQRNVFEAQQQLER